MASLNLSTKKLRYSAADENVMAKALDLLHAMAEYDPAVKQDATTAKHAVNHVALHIEAQRNCKPEAK